MTEATTADLMDAARAAGLEPCLESKWTAPCAYEEGIYVQGATHWHPLTNADQREMLAEKCDLSVSRFGELGGAVSYFDHEHGSTTSVHWPSTAPDFRHAVVIAAARYWRARNG